MTGSNAEDGKLHRSADGGGLPDESALEERIARWHSETLPRALTKLGIHEHAGHTFVSPRDVRDFDYLRDIGLPGEYPFTAWLYPTRGFGRQGGDSRLHRAGRYSGYGTATDCRDYYIEMHRAGFRTGGPNLASDLPSQLGWDSDDPHASGEVGTVGVAIDSLRDFEIIYEAFRGEVGIDRIASNWTINAPATVYIAYYCALADNLGIPRSSLRCTPQNDILKEYIGRGLYIFPVRPSMRLTRDTISFMHEYMPLSNPISICAEHIRYAGATTTQSFAFAFANAKQYVELGIDAGLDVDDFVRRFTFRGFGDSTLNFLYGIAAPRAARRIWARIMRNDYGARDDRTCLLRGGEHAWGNSYMRMTPNRPVNNIVRATVEALIYSLASGEVPGGVPFDEPLGLGHSIEAQQVARDVQRILLHEGRLGDLLDPLGGSYAVESLTNEIEAETLDELKRVMEAGGSVAAIESGYCRKVVAESAWRSQQRLETGEDVWVGVNRYVGADEVEVQIQRTSEYDLERRANAEERQIASLKALRNDRPSTEVRATLRRLQTVASSNENILPALIDCAKAYATIGEVCQVLRDTFGEANYA